MICDYKSNATTLTSLQAQNTMHLGDVCVFVEAFRTSSPMQRRRSTCLEGVNSSRPLSNLSSTSRPVLNAFGLHGLCFADLQDPGGWKRKRSARVLRSVVW